MIVYGIWLILLSTITFILYGFDKAQSIRRGRRIPEVVLHILSLSGGFPGGWIGRAVFRHKTKKMVFFLVLAFSTLFHLVLIYLLLTK